MEVPGEPRVLLIDDDVELCELLSEYLAREGMETRAVHDGESGTRRAQSGEFAAVVLDVMLPGIGGFEVLRRLRAPSSPAARLPVLMLTARGDEVDRVLGLELGADDYLPKPFSSRELVARLRAILRRAQAPEAASTGGVPLRAAPVRVGDIELEHAARQVRRGGDVVELTSAEFELLDVLMQSAGRIVSREQIATRALGRPLMPFDRTIDVHVSNLRRKLGAAPDGGERIKAVRGVGYLLVLPANGADEPANTAST